MKKNVGKTKGFTIVELLIVVVVIGILAAIATVAYNGVQERAYSARVIATVDAYAKVLRLYHVENGQLPPSSAGVACLGRVSDYPASDGFAAGACVKNSSGSTGNIAIDAFADELEQYMQGRRLPNPAIRSARGTHSWGPMD